MISDAEYAIGARRADELEARAEKALQNNDDAMAAVRALQAISARLELLTEVLRDRPTAGEREAM